MYIGNPGPGVPLAGWAQREACGFGGFTSGGFDDARGFAGARGNLRAELDSSYKFRETYKPTLTLSTVTIPLVDIEAERRREAQIEKWLCPPPKTYSIFDQIKEERKFEEQERRRYLQINGLFE